MKSFSLEQLISKTLRTGITLAAALGIAGGSWYLCSRGSNAVSFAEFRGTEMTFRSPAMTLRTIFSSSSVMPGTRALAVVQLGILLLLATPVVRVAFSAIGFAIERDRIYVGITLVVLTTLLVSAFLL